MKKAALAVIALAAVVALRGLRVHQQSQDRHGRVEGAAACGDDASGDGHHATGSDEQLVDAVLDRHTGRWEHHLQPRGLDHVPGWLDDGCRGLPR